MTKRHWKAGEKLPPADYAHEPDDRAQPEVSPEDAARHLHLHEGLAAHRRQFAARVKRERTIGRIGWTIALGCIRAHRVHRALVTWLAMR